MSHVIPNVVPQADPPVAESEESQSGGYQMPEIPRRYAPRNDTLGCYPVLNHAGI